MATDKFYIRPHSGRVEWVYYNPDSDAGGQYVYNLLNAHVIEEAAQAAGTDATVFFEHAGIICTQYLVDAGELGFAETDYHFKHAPCDFEDCTNETMAALVSWAREREPANEASEDEDEWEGSL